MDPHAPTWVKIDLLQHFFVDSTEWFLVFISICLVGLTRLLNSRYSSEPLF